MIRPAPPSTPPPRGPARLADADRCVMCGLCVPGCPTFGLDRLESRGPRGRVVAMLALRDGRLSPTDPAVLANLDSCTSCGRCEAVCPAKVPYTRLIDEARALLRRQQPLPLKVRLLRAVLVRPRLAQGLAAVARVLRVVADGLGRLGRHRADVSRLVSRLEQPHRLRHDGPRPDPGRGVLVFAGCTAPFFQGDTLRALETLANATGQRLDVVGDACCGALHAHSGEPERGAVQTRACLAAITGTDTLGMRRPAAASADGGGFRRTPPTRTVDTDACVVLDSGCLLHLRAATADAPAIDFRSVTEWLVTLDLPRERWTDTPIRVALHTPCTARFGLKAGDDTRRWLDALPGVDIVAALDEPACCGAGGLTGHVHPQQAQRLGRATLQALRVLDDDGSGHRRRDVDVVVTTNVGCRVHLAAQLADGATTPPSPDVMSLAQFVASRLKPLSGR